MARPNILMILSDQEQHPSLLPPGLPRPALEWLLERGVLFDRHHVVTLPCGPSRSTIYTGLHTPHTGVVENPSPRSPGMSSQVPTIGTILRENGYYTAYKGKWHVSVVPPVEPFRGTADRALEEYGFSDYNPNGDPVGVGWDGFREDPAIAADAANWLLDRGRRPRDEKPWFLAVNFVNPHDVMFFDATGRMNNAGEGSMPSRRLPAPYADVYRRDWDVPLPASFDDDLTMKPAAQSQLDHLTQKLLGMIPKEDEEAWRRLRSYYYNCLADLDRHVRTVLDALRDSGHDRDTIVIYTTDHGEAAGAHGLREKPTSLYREVVNVPLVVVHPEVAGGTVVRSLSSAIDIVPTLLAFAGVDSQRGNDRPPQRRGYDLGAAVGRGDSAGAWGRRGVLFCMSRVRRDVAGREHGRPRMLLRGVFDGRWKLARYFDRSEHVQPKGLSELVASNDLELYDTDLDPGELRNRAADPECRHDLTRLSRLLSELVTEEIGVDDGRELDAAGESSPQAGIT